MRRIARARTLSVLVTGLTLAGYSVSLLRERATAFAYGTSAELDGFLVALTAVTLIAITSSRALYDPLVLTLSALRESDRVAAARLARAVLGASAAVLALATAALVFANEAMTDLIAPGLTQHSAEVAFRMTTILVPAVLLLGTWELARAVLHAWDEFVLSSVLPVVATGITFVAIVSFAPAIGIAALAYGTLAGAAAQFTLVLVYLARAGVLGVRGLPARADVRGLVAPALVGLVLVAVGNGSIAIDRVLGSLLPEGRISALNYAARLVDVATVVAVSGVATVMYPRFARMRASGQGAAVVRALRASVAATVLAAFAIMAVLVPFAEPVVGLLFGTGRFDDASRRVTGEALAVYALSLPFVATALILARALYSFRKFRALMITGVLFLAIKLAVGLALVASLQHSGVALATVIAYVAVSPIGPLIVARAVRRGEANVPYERVP